MNRIHWLVPALASLAFFVFSMVVASREGPFGFIDEHLRNGWSAQIGIDLVLAATVALVFVGQRGRKVGMRVAPWVVATLLLGSIGLLAMVARVLYLQSKTSRVDVTGVSPAQSTA